MTQPNETPSGDEFNNLITPEDLAELTSITAEVLADYDSEWPVRVFNEVGQLMHKVVNMTPDCFSQPHSWMAALRVVMDMATAIALREVIRVDEDGAEEDSDEAS